MPRSWAGPAGTALMIRDHLREREDYPYHIFKELRDKVLSLDVSRRRTKRPYLPPSYASMRSMLFVLQKLGLVAIIRRSPDRPGRYGKVWYRLVLGRVDDVRWESPKEALYAPDRFEARVTRSLRIRKRS